MSDPKKPAPWDSKVDLNADEDEWPLGMNPDGELNIVDENTPDSEEQEAKRSGSW
jgi:hypothetical protein